jgi:CrcB protein
LSYRGPVTALLVAAGAAVGAPARYLLGVWLAGALPWGTLAANVLGSFALGLVIGAGLPGPAVAALGTGFCGGFTTYSALALETTNLPVRRAALNVAANLGLGLVAAAGGVAGGVALGMLA